MWQSRPTNPITLEDCIQEGELDARRILNQIQPGPDDEVVCAAGEEDEQLGFRGPSMGPEELLSLRIPFRLIRRFVITQASGKKRCIDDAHLGFQSEFSSDGNRLQFCSAIQPCLHVQALAKAFALRGVDLESWPDSISTFGEDLPMHIGRFRCAVTTAGRA